jgi:hypothetical protein
MSTLTPADPDRCQAEYRGGSFMTLGPRPWIRCDNLPVYIAYETTPGKDGQCGSMSVCQPCREEMEKAMPNAGIRFEAIVRKAPAAPSTAGLMGDPC